jgi:hypothetical protein
MPETQLEHQEAKVAEIETHAGTADSGEADQSAAAVASRQARRTLEEQLAEIRSQERKLLEKIRKRDRELRAQYEKELWELLKTEKLDEAPISAWRKAAPHILAALTAASA